jgi:hypothetical protein
MKDFWFGFAQPSILGLMAAVLLVHFYPAGWIG